MGPLRPHPNERPCAHEDGSGQAGAPSACFKDEPLAREVRECNDVAEECEFVEALVVEVVCCIQPYKSRH